MQQSLRTYYNYLYPFHTLVNWLTQNQRSNLAHRQLSFEYQGIGVERYVVFTDADAMKARMIDSRQKTPLKVDAGAIWNRVPQKESNGKTIERELIFDFDMNDYDDVRTCCSGKKVCVQCWKLLIIAVEVIEKALAEDFDLHKLMFVFSGGRGLHIWVCDKRARQLKDSLRKAIVDYLELVTGNDKAASLLSEKVIQKTEDNPYMKQKLNNPKARETREQLINYYMKNHVKNHVQRSLQIISKRFIQIMTDQDIFKHQKCVDLMLKIIASRNQKLKERIQEKWLKTKDRSVEQNFREMVNEIIKYEMAQTTSDYVIGKQQNGGKIYRLTLIQQQIMLSFLYPRMDYNVSTMQNHLLKLPFSVHPSSHKISIPLFKSQLQGFNPKNCVSLEDLLKGLDYSNLVDRNEINAQKSLLRVPIQALEEFTSILD